MCLQESFELRDQKCLIWMTERIFKSTGDDGRISEARVRKVHLKPEELNPSKRTDRQRTWRSSRFIP